MATTSKGTRLQAKQLSEMSPNGKWIHLNWNLKVLFLVWLCSEIGANLYKFTGSQNIIVYQSHNIDYFLVL